MWSRTTGLAFRIAKSSSRGFSNLSPIPAANPTPSAAAAAVKSWRRDYTPGLLTKDELEQYYQEGFVIKHNVFTPQEYQGCVDAINEMVDELATQLHTAGKIKDPHKNAGFLDRLTLLEKQFPSASVIIHKRGILPMAFAELWSHPRLLSIAQQILGKDVGGHPVWNLRAKTPDQTEAIVPWHQDNAYLHYECWNVQQLTAWVPLVPANKQNGCLEMLRRVHRKGLTSSHTGCWANTWYVEVEEKTLEKQLDAKMQQDVVLCEMPVGSVLLFNNLTPHRSLPNKSDIIRWSLDLRWQNPKLPNGSFGANNCIVMSKSDDPSHRIDWGPWTQKNRQTAFLSLEELKRKDAFDTTIWGPWMSLWPITNRNKHTDAYEQSQKNFPK